MDNKKVREFDPHSMTRRSFLAGSALLAAGVLSACSQGATASSSSAASASSPLSATANGSVLVAYYSAQGHTKAVAEAIAAELGADLFVIEPAKPYSEADLNWRDESSRVCAEHDDPALRDGTLVANAPANFADYGTVFVGYPIWWQGASWAMTAFASENDFTGKTVIPFCTSTSSGTGNSATDLAALAGSGDWKEGRRFPERADATEAASWAKGQLS